MSKAGKKKIEVDNITEKVDQLEMKVWQEEENPKDLMFHKESS